MYQQYHLNKRIYFEISQYKVMMEGGGGGTVKKWDTLEHNGVLFHPQYEPHKTPIKINNQIVILESEAEEYLTYFVHPRFDKYRNSLFNKNFLKDWKVMLPYSLQQTIKNIDMIDYSGVRKYVEEKIEERKKMLSEKTSQERKEEKQINDEKTKKYRTALVDGVEQAIDNFIVEPPTIFVGRGKHPLSGSIKKRIYPEEVTLNIGDGMTVPKPIVPGSDRAHTWGKILNDGTLEWIASWQNNVTNKINYARFGRKSSFKMTSDENKYNKARNLKKNIEKIRSTNNHNLHSENIVTAQHATALYLIDNLALRIGNEKKENEADTVGVATLTLDNVFLEDESRILKLDFLGKDSVRYVNKIKVPDRVYENLKQYTDLSTKTSKSLVFDRISADTLNQYIRNFMEGLTSKVFRTYNASHLMQIELEKIEKKMKDYKGKDYAQKIKYLYDMANLEVARLCNHQKVLSSKAPEQMKKIKLKINEQKKKIKTLKEQYDAADEKKKKVLRKRLNNEKLKLKKMKDKKKIQNESKTLSAGTSKINYIDPRITMAFLKRMNLFDSIKLFFNESQKKQFAWAQAVSDDYIF